MMEYSISNPWHQLSRPNRRQPAIVKLHDGRNGSVASRGNRQTEDIIGKQTQGLARLQSSEFGRSRTWQPPVRYDATHQQADVVVDGKTSPISDWSRTPNV